MNYILHIAIMITLYVILGLSLNLVVGYSGLLSLCHAAFYGAGAYACTLLMTKGGCGFPAAVLGAVVVGGLLSLAVGWPSLRLKGDFFVLGTMGFQMIVYAVLYNCVGLTRGPYGIPGIPKPAFLGLEFRSLPAFLALSATLAASVAFLHWQIARSPFGRGLQAVRDDELAARALGKNPDYFRVAAFVLAGGMAAIAGALYATYVSYIDPTSFGLDEAIFIVTVVVIGGAGSLWGPVVGAAFVVLLPEALRFLHVPGAIAPNVRQIMFGLLLILAMRFRPQGIAGRYAFD
jgi:branched-chain amino acid transport system permease protein